MSVNQSRLESIRYIKRQNVEEEAKMVGNHMRDIITQYGVDCRYYKIKTPYLDKFKSIIDENALLMQAYGEDAHPDYNISSEMITYMEVEQDIIQFQKYGAIPNMDVNFYFDVKDFACSLAYKLGQLKEYPIKEQRFCIEVPEQISDYVEYDVNEDGLITVTSMMSCEVVGKDFDADYGIKEISSWVELSSFDDNGECKSIDRLSMKEYYEKKIRGQINTERMYLSDDVFPYGIGYGAPATYKCDILEGRFAVKLEPYEIDKEYTVMCRPYQHSEVDVHFPVNDSIYKSFDYRIQNKDFLDQILFLTYRVSKVKVGDKYRFILNGKLHGAVLFHDLTKIGKYMDMIHPDVGDIVTIDFPDENNRQQFEITDCNDKNLGSDGINPLLHRYIWKCKARRYINSDEDFPEKNEGNERWKEKIDFLNNSEEVIDKQIGKYDDKSNDAKYGGYEKEIESHDKQKLDEFDPEHQNFEFRDDGSLLVIHEFGNCSKLLTDGYDLFFKDTNGYGHKITYLSEVNIANTTTDSGLQYIKATDNALYFINFNNESCRICEDENITQGEVELCLNSLIDITYNTGNVNNEGDFYYKFKESNTVLMSLNDHLYCRFGNKNRKMLKIC